MASPHVPIAPLMTTAEVAALLGVCTRTVRRMVQAGRLPAYRTGRGLRFDRADLAAFLDRTRVRAS